MKNEHLIGLCGYRVLPWEAEVRPQGLLDTFVPWRMSIQCAGIKFTLACSTESIALEAAFRAVAEDTSLSPRDTPPFSLIYVEIWNVAGDGHMRDVSLYIRSKRGNWTKVED